MPAIFYLTILFLMTIIGICLRLHRGRVRCRRELAGLARSLQLNYRADDALQLARRYRRLTLMREGHDRRTWDLISGPTAQGAMTCFAYRYEVGFGINRAVRAWRVAVVETERPWGRLALRSCRTGQGHHDIWEPSCSEVTLDYGADQRWMLIGRTGRLPAWFPSALFGRLAGFDWDLHLELCDHLLALQVPMDDTSDQAKRLMQALKETVAQLLAAADMPGRHAEPAPSDAQSPQPGGPHAR
ncbi:MAG: hypothetical protein ACE5GE_11875 [Phycisphaerae bacterium]